MPHEFRELQYQPHEVFTNILVGGAVSSIVIVLLVLYLRWRHPKQPKAPTARRDAPAAKKRRRRR